MLASPTGPARPPARRAVRRLLAVALGLGTLAALACAAELVFRARAEALGFPPARRDAARETVCRGWAQGFAPRPHSIYRRPSERADVNEQGFRDREWTLERRPGVPRILCLGGSTTEGSNGFGLGGSYPFLLETLLRRHLGREVEVLNAGMSGWNSAEMVAAWFLDLIDYRPDLVVIHEAINDVEPRNQPGFRRDYAHYRHAFRAPHFAAPLRWLARESDLVVWLLGRTPPTIYDLTVVTAEGERPFAAGRFPPETLAPYRRNLLSIGRSVTALGGTLALMTLPYAPRLDEEEPGSPWVAGIADANSVMRALAREQGWILCDLRAVQQQDPEAWRPLFSDAVHVSEQGDLRKAELLARALLDARLFERLDAGELGARAEGSAR